MMKNILALEELAMFALAVVGMYYQPLQFKWWLWPVLFLLPDVGMMGYLANTEIGAFTYNLFHHKLVAIAVLLTGYFISNNYLVLAGLILFGHSSFDRVLGFGLKYGDSFKHTHLGTLS